MEGDAAQSLAMVGGLTELHYLAIAAIAAAISGFFAFVTALGATWQARAANEAHAAQVFLAFSERYNSREMAEALKTLARWYLSTPDTRAADWVAAKRAGDAAALKLNEQRRLVSRFYLDVARLRLMGQINRRFARELVENNGLNVFYKVCEPMNALNHPGRVVRYSECLAELCSGYGDGSVYKSAPSPALPRPKPWWAFWR